jgi:hypothetical protein
MIRILLALAGALGVCPALAAAPRVEVAFVLDATGSMGGYIGQARDRIKAIAADLATGEPAPEVRFALVRFRDVGDAYVTQAVPFTADLDAMRSALDATDADGGGDTPEAVLEGLRVGVEDLKWSQDQGVLRLLYLVGDAEPQHYATSPTLEYIAVRALERGIVIHSIACGAMAAEGQRFFEEVARLSEGRPFRLADGEATVHSKAGAAGAGSLAAAVSGSARAYSGAIGVGFTGRPVVATALEIPNETGLLGAHLRHVRDAASFADLWTAHGSLGARAPMPTIDFDREHVLVVGGADTGLRLDQLTADGTVQVARLAKAAPGARFYRIPASELPVIMGEF